VPADVLDLDGDGDVIKTVPYDQRGARFPRIAAGLVDLGAVEVSDDVVTQTVSVAADE
jgi:hypothetical protein